MATKQRAVILAVALVFGLMAFAPATARADKVFGISSIGIDEMTDGSLQAMSEYLKNLREKSPWREDRGQLIVEPSTVHECTKDRFTMTATHRRVGPRFQDGLTFTRCGETVGSYFVERSGPGVRHISDDDLFTANIPLPSRSEYFRFYASFYSIDIISNATPHGRVSSYSYLIGQIPFHTIITEANSLRGNLLISSRSYDFNIYYETRLSAVSFREQRMQRQGEAPSYDYQIVGERALSAPSTAARFHELYQSNIEGNTVETVAQLVRYPPKFPY